MSVHCVVKGVGETPLEALQAFRQARGLSEAKTSYAGRLDPMADGLLLVLEGDACYEQAQWQHHSKGYAWELLLGLSTDTFDILGLAAGDAVIEAARLTAAAQQAEDMLSRLRGPMMQSYPPYSSVRVQGHPLFWWAQQGRLDEVAIPQSEVHVEATHVGCVRWIRAADVLAEMQRKIQLVSGSNFRQAEILGRWSDVLASLSHEVQFPVLSVRSKVSSGTYIRALAHRVGADCGVGGLAWSITRFQVGDSLTLTQAIPSIEMPKALFLQVFRLVVVQSRKGF